MSPGPISLSPDLKRLRDEGYDIVISPHGQLLARDIPYVTSEQTVARGIMVSTLNLAGEATTRPDTHVVHFIGEHPCDRTGNALQKIVIGAEAIDIGGGPVTVHTFSSKPPDGYPDYYEKMTAYIRIVSNPAQGIQPEVTAQTFPVVDDPDPESVFNYLETASSRAGIEAATEKLKVGKVGIVGLGGTGSYILDLVAKTPVHEIHLFDGDDFLQHNAFRSPGAPSREELAEAVNKAVYWRDRYAPMRKGIVAHPEPISEENAGQLTSMDFVFISIDQGEIKSLIVQQLESAGTSFIDVGMGVFLMNGALGGQLRTTTSTPTTRLHVHEKGRISFKPGEIDGLYRRNIQIADLNALNAALAVIRWKRLCGFYLDLEREHFSVYQVDGNQLVNEDQ
jgi:hypothetical protein